MNKTILIICSIIHINLYCSENQLTLPLLPQELIAHIFSYTFGSIKRDARNPINWNIIHKIKENHQSLSRLSHYWSSYSNVTLKNMVVLQPTSLITIIICDKEHSLKTIKLCNAPDKKDVLFDMFESLCKSNDITQVNHVISLFEKAQFRFNRPSTLYARLPQLRESLKTLGISAPDQRSYHIPPPLPDEYPDYLFRLS